MELNNFYIDAEASEKGVWIDVDEDGTKLLIGRAGGSRYLSHFRNLMSDEYIERQRKGENVDKEQEELLVQSLVDCVLLGWEGLTIDGEEVEYSKEKAYAILSNENYSSFRDLVASLGTNVSNFKKSIQEKGIDNIKKS